MFLVRNISQLFSLSCLQNKYTQKCLTDCTDHRSSASFPSNLCFHLHIFYRFYFLFFFHLASKDNAPYASHPRPTQGDTSREIKRTQNYSTGIGIHHSVLVLALINVQKFPPQKRSPPVYTLLFSS